jgi:hypothetical protein
VFNTHSARRRRGGSFIATMTAEPTMMTAITKERNNDSNWMQSFTSFLEDEGLLKLVQHAAYHAPGLALRVLTAPVIVPVNFVGGLLSAGDDDDYDDDLDNDTDNNNDGLTYMTPTHSYDNLALCDTVAYTRKDYNNINDRGRDEAPFILKVVFNVADIILNTISPGFKIHEKNTGRYHKRKHSSRVIRANIDNDYFSPIDIKMIQSSSLPATSMSASSSTNNDYYTTDDGSIVQYFDPLSTSSVSESICGTDSIYFDAEESIPSLDSSTDSQDGSTLASSTDDNSPIPLDVLARMDEEEKDAKFYLNVSGIISSGVRGFYDSFLLGAEDNTIVNGKYFTLRSNNSSMTNNYNGPYLTSLNCMLDELVKNSLLTASIVNGDGSDDPSWKPEDQTKKFLNRHRRHSCSNNNNNSHSGTSLLMSFTAEDNTEWENILKSEVLKWTRSDPNSSGPMLRTQGIIDMSPTNLKDLLLDCDRVSLYNKNMVEKENITTLDGIVNGEARIIRSVMKFPFVGTTMTTLSLTHARSLLDDNNNDVDGIGGGYIIVSQSVGEDSSSSSSGNNNSSMESSNPYYSISIIQPVISNPNMTMLINVAQTSNVPIPKFLVHKVAFMSAVDFFKNLRALC